MVPLTDAVDSHAPNGSLWTKPEHGQSKASLFVRDAIRMTIDKHGSSAIALKLLLPTVAGYPVRKDSVQQRFLTCDLVDTVADFTTLRQQIQAFDFGGEAILQMALDGALGAILLKQLPGIHGPLLESALVSLETEVSARLSYPWIVDSPLPTKRLAMVEGRPDPAVSPASLGIYRAAHALGVVLVVLDHDGHWVQDQSMEHMRDEFIVCDLNPDEGLPDRIIEALSKSKSNIDAITTYTDTHLLATARAAKKLGLHTNPPEAVEMCRDKKKTREVASTDMRVLRITGVADLKEQLTHLTLASQYPLIVKPTTGSSSEGVCRVESESDLFDAVQRNEEKFPGVDSLVEPYISGPEIDANFVLSDDKFIWSEINDDFPSSAENPQHTNTSGESSSAMSFAEMSTIMPSMLPDAELSLLKSSLAETLLKLGFKNGVYHLEATVEDSRKRYAVTDKGTKLVDCRPEIGRTSDPSVFLIEINARIPGHQESYAVEYTYGIDYFALYMLMAFLPHDSVIKTAEDTAVKSVICALSQPLRADVQYPTNIIFIPAERGGTFMTAKPLPEYLTKHIPKSAVYMKEGEVIKDPLTEGKWPFIAYFLVTAALNGIEGYEQVRTIGDVVREAFEYELR